MLRIYPTLYAGDNEVFQILKKHMVKMLDLAAAQFDCEMRDASLISHMISKEDAEISANTYRLEFVIEVGSTSGVKDLEARAQALEADFGNSCDLNHIRFNLIVRVFAGSATVDHKPVA